MAINIARSWKAGDQLVFKSTHCIKSAEEKFRKLNDKLK